MRWYSRVQSTEMFNSIFTTIIMLWIKLAQKENSYDSYSENYNPVSKQFID